MASQGEVHTKVPGWAWIVGVILIGLAAFAGVQMMNAQEKAKETSSLLEAARTAQTKAETALKELQVTLKDKASQLEKAIGDVEAYRKRVEELEAKQSEQPDPASESAPAQ